MLTDLQLLDQVIQEERARLTAAPSVLEPQDPALRFFAEQLKPADGSTGPGSSSRLPAFAVDPQCSAVRPNSDSPTIEV